MSSDNSFNIGIVLYDQVEELDFCGPFEVLKSAAYHNTHQDGQEQSEQRPWNVFTVAENTELIHTSGGLLIQPQYSFDDHPTIHVLLIPGGNASSQLDNPHMIAWLEKVTPQAEYLTSVCTGAFLLGQLGLLDGLNATTHWSALESLETSFPAVHVQKGVRWVDEGRVITSAGISAGMDMSLHLVERLLGRDVAESVAKYMEYTWNENENAPVVTAAQ